MSKPDDKTRDDADLLELGAASEETEGGDGDMAEILTRLPI